MARLLRDAGGFLLICLLGAGAGLLLNQARAKPLPLVYIPASQRATEAPTGGHGPVIGRVSLPGVEGLLGREDVIFLDARPALLYMVGHLPGALSLPKEEFQKSFSALEPRLRAADLSHIIVYCSGADCEDSAVVAQALSSAGLQHLAIFEGGWEEWELRANQTR